MSASGNPVICCVSLCEFVFLVTARDSSVLNLDAVVRRDVFVPPPAVASGVCRWLL
jgi:hypothetical protein